LFVIKKFFPLLILQSSDSFQNPSHNIFHNLTKKLQHIVIVRLFLPVTHQLLDFIFWNTLISISNIFFWKTLIKDFQKPLIRCTKKFDGCRKKHPLGKYADNGICEMNWWEGVSRDVNGVGKVRVVAPPYPTR